MNRRFRPGLPTLSVAGAVAQAPQPLAGTHWPIQSGFLGPDGSLWHWGQDDYGILGTNDSCHRVPRRLDVVGDWKVVGCEGDQFVGLRRDGSVWGWNGSLRGHHRVAQLPSRVPEQIAPGTNWSQVCSGSSRFFLLREDGVLFGLGDNRHGALGDGTLQQRSTVVAVTPGHRWRTVAAGAWTAAGIRTDGTLWGWGEPLGSVPVQIGGATNWVEVQAAGYLHTARNAAGEVVVWGANANHVAAGATTSPLDRLTVLPDSGRWQTVWPCDIAMLARDTNGLYWCWGLGLHVPGNSPKDALLPRPLTVPAAITAVWPLSADTLAGWSPDGRLWTQGTILGAECDVPPSELRKMKLARWLLKAGLRVPRLADWAEIQTHSAEFIPVARFRSR
ncbi:MAG: hypothetical protein J0L84_01385 [Verrucomicrobia bacterium]|nr:hypothetical protein [Verrucomicrobiota bacterium]